MRREHEIAIVGCGAVARDHIRALGRLKGAKVVAICDRDERIAAQASASWSIDRYYTSLSEMLDKERVSLVSILTPPESHAPLAAQVIRHDVHVLIEKPLTLSTAEADPIIALLKDRKVKLTVNYNWLFSRVMLQARALIAEGTVGETLGVEVRCLHTKDDEMASNPNHWSHKLPGGRFGEVLPHPVYVLQSFLGNSLEVATVIARKRGAYPWMAYDELWASLESPNGIGHVYLSFNSPRLAVVIDIYGTKGLIQVDLVNHTLIELGGRTLSKLDSARDSLAIASRLTSLTLENALRSFRSERGEYALRTIYDRTLRSIATDEPPPITLEMAYQTVATVQEICGRF